VKVMQIARLLIVASARLSRVRPSACAVIYHLQYDHLRRRPLFEHRTQSPAAATAAFAGVRRSVLSVCLSVYRPTCLHIQLQCLYVWSNFRFPPACQLTLYSSSVQEQFVVVPAKHHGVLHRDFLMQHCPFRQTRDSLGGM